MTNENKISRLAGALYLVVVVTGLFSLIYVPSQITVSGDSHATVTNIVAHSPLFRAGIAAFLVKQVAFLLLPLVLFKLLRPVHQSIAALMVALAVVSVPIALVSLISRLSALDILSGSYSQALAPAQLQSQAMLSLNAYGNGLLVTTLFWGLWLLPFGYLVIRSGFLPKLPGLSAAPGRSWRNRHLSMASRGRRAQTSTKCGLTIRSSRTCFVTPKPWQKKLAMALAPLRKSA